ncbi:MAG: tRNA modification GTPase [Isosphaeraceae bacterium]|jgi:tRNA modification GTPase|nr:MAG: tRNA modification GTPase [Isosphaeraceae bacterium]
MSDPGTRAVVLTAPGRAAVAVVRVWGAGAVELVSETVRLRGQASGAMKVPRLGRMRDGRGDEVVVIGDPGGEWVELQCHGGRAAVASVLEELAGRGVEVVDRATWYRLDAPNRLVAEARADLERAETDRAAEILIDQAEGALAEAVAGWIERLGRDEVGAETVRAEIREAVGRGRIGRRLIAGWRIVLAGRPNVGKSTLFNALVGFERSLVDPEPGTTRDLVTRRGAFGGWPVVLIDSAGLRASQDPIESEGIDRSRVAMARADLVLELHDGSVPREAGDGATPRRAGQVLQVATKRDLAACWSPEDAGMVWVSARTGEGLGQLVDRIAARLVPDPPQPGDPVPTRGRQIRGLRAAIRWLGRGEIGQAVAALRSLLDGS